MPDLTTGIDIHIRFIVFVTLHSFSIGTQRFERIVLRNASSERMMTALRTSAWLKTYGVRVVAFLKEM